MENKVVLTVTEINEYIKTLMEGDPMLGQVWLKGEISNFKRHSSGHLYLTLKDGGSVLRAVMFRGAAGNLLFEPKDGMKVMVRCKISVYPASGNYQAYIAEMEQDGVGDLHAAFEALKQKLYAEGLFAPEHKKPIPRFPSRVGIVTSPTGAALQDMKNVMGRRFPYASLTIYPSLVQGEEAATQVMEGIRYFNSTKSADVIIIGRGGGSIEDLWAFNSEELARVIYDSDIPIISAVGHEIDFTRPASPHPFGGRGVGGTGGDGGAAAAGKCAAKIDSIISSKCPDKTDAFGTAVCSKGIYAICGYVKRSAAQN